MKITELTGLPSLGAPTLDDPDIAGLTADSREVRPGFLFAALRGTAADGRAFAGEAVARGAIAILTDDPAALALSPEQRDRIVILRDENPARRLAQLAARFYPRQPKTIAAVTGTNGKTSVAHFTRELWTAFGYPAASLGTLGLVSPAGRRSGALTTPDPIALHRDLDELAARGVEYAAIEASSHGLAQYRLDGIAPQVAAFTNLTRDHLDYHGDMATYRAAKERLFRALLQPDGTAVLNADSPEFSRLNKLCRARGLRVIGYGTADHADIRIRDMMPLRIGQRLALDVFSGRYDVELSLVGAFQAMNMLAALGIVEASGGDLATAIAALPSLPEVPGRLQHVGQAGCGAAVFVDYAHTPDALTNVLSALRRHTVGRLIVVFGAGGDRDRGKRPLMGQAAADLADLVYVTDDNPRSEDTAEIRRAVLAGAPQAIEIGDRGAAIAAAIAGLRHGDVLVIAGKGHETGQIIGQDVLPFDDAVVARDALAAIS